MPVLPANVSSNNASDEVFTVVSGRAVVVDVAVSCSGMSNTSGGSTVRLLATGPLLAWTRVEPVTKHEHAGRAQGRAHSDGDTVHDGRAMC